MRLAWTSAVALAAIGCVAAFAQVPVAKPETCLKVRTAALRLDAISATIRACTIVIGDQSQPRPVHAAATAQRGMLYARRWGLTDATKDANQAIADISAAMDFRVFDDSKIQQLLIWRGRLYEATRQMKKAGDDYRAVLRLAPFDETARAALLRLDAPTH